LQSISVFNNKGGVGKTTLTFHLAHALAELGKRTLVVDLDPQCNLTIFALPDETIWKMWAAETITSTTLIVRAKKVPQLSRRC